MFAAKGIEPTQTLVLSNINSHTIPPFNSAKKQRSSESKKTENRPEDIIGLGRQVYLILQGLSQAKLL